MMEAALWIWEEEWEMFGSGLWRTCAGQLHLGGPSPEVGLNERISDQNMVADVIGVSCVD